MHGAVELLLIVMHCASRTHKSQRSGHGLGDSAHLVPLLPRALHAAPQMKEIDAATLAFQQKVMRGLGKAQGTGATANGSCGRLWCRS